MSDLELARELLPDAAGSQAWSRRYSGAVMNTFGPPQRVLVRGEGCWVWDADGRRYLDLLAGIAVNALGHAHPSIIAAVSGQLATLGHVSNFFASAPQVVLAERLLALLDVPVPGRVFFTSSGTEAVEAAVKLSRRTGRSRLVAAVDAFHGRTMGALALTWKPAYREPFEPLPGVVEFVPYGDVEALTAAVGPDTAAVVLEPVQGEAGVVPAPPGYLAAARRLTSAAGALLVLDEVQTGIGRTGEWFAFQRDGVVPDVVTLAKGLGGGLPVGACIGLGPAAELLGPGQHGSTFGGNPVAAAAALTVLHVIERDGLLEHVTSLGESLRRDILALGHPLVREVRGRGLLLGIGLATACAPAVAAAALEAGFVVNAPNPATIRLAPPLVLSAEQAASFVAALPRLLATAAEPSGGGAA